jgi:SAM-dependent methyltransferase
VSVRDQLPCLLARGAAVRALWWARPVRDAVNRWLRPYQGQLGPAELADYLEGQIRDCFQRAGVDPASLGGREILEIGPGGNFGLAAVLLGFGARRVVCLDLDRLCFDSGIPAPLFDELNRRFAGRLESCVERSDDRCLLPAERFTYRVGTGIERAPFAAASFDFIFSCACLEHVERPDAALAEMHRLLRPGGRMLHQIDFRDHRDFARPLEFLRYSPAAWRWICTGAHLNRWRPSRFREAFGAAGFRTLFETATGDDVNGDRVPEGYLSALRPHLHPEFASASEEDLTTLGLLVLAERV